MEGGRRWGEGSKEASESIDELVDFTLTAEGEEGERGREVGGGREVTTGASQDTQYGDHEEVEGSVLRRINGVLWGKRRGEGRRRRGVRVCCSFCLLVVYYGWKRTRSSGGGVMGGLGGERRTHMHIGHGGQSSRAPPEVRWVDIREKGAWDWVMFL